MGTEDFQIRYYNRQAARVVDELRALADRIEREANPHPTPGVTGTPRHMAAAERVNHALTWGIANIGAHSLFDAAFHADDAERDFLRHSTAEDK